MRHPAFLTQTRLIVYYEDENDGEAFDALKTLVTCGHAALLELHEDKDLPVWNEQCRVLDIRMELGPTDAEYRLMCAAMIQIGELGYTYELGICGTDEFELESNVARPRMPLLHKCVAIRAAFDDRREG